MQYENEARVFFTAKSENEGFARLFAAGFLTQLDPTISEMTDVKTAVSEAVTNAIIHGYEEKGGLVELFCGYIGRKIYIEIADTGKGIENIERAREPLYTSKPEMERSGMGFTIMETFMEKVRIESRIGVGTRIFMENTGKGVIPWSRPMNGFVWRRQEMPRQRTICYRKIPV